MAKMNLRYSRPSLHSLGAPRTAACVSGSSAATSGYECSHGDGVNEACLSNGSSAIKVGGACVDFGSAAIGVFATCDSGIAPVNVSGGPGCIAGSGFV